MSTWVLLLSLSACDPTGEASAPPASEGVHPLAGVQVRCPVSASLAGARARELESTADARFERVPFDLGDAPLAVLAARESEACHRLAGDREGRARVEAKRKRMEEELESRFERAQLALAIALREERPRAALREAKRLSLLTSRAGAPMAAYRAWVSEVERRAQAELSETETLEEEP